MAAPERVAGPEGENAAGINLYLCQRACSAFLCFISFISQRHTHSDSQGRQLHEAAARNSVRFESAAADTAFRLCYCPCIRRVLAT